MMTVKIIDPESGDRIEVEIEVEPAAPEVGQTASWEIVAINDRKIGRRELPPAWMYRAIEDKLYKCRRDDIYEY